jgi:hypothetical protein
VTTYPWTWVKGLKTVRFRFRRIDDFPDVDVHFSTEEGNFIDHGNIDQPISVLQDFHHSAILGEETKWMFSIAFW